MRASLWRRQLHRDPLAAKSAPSLDSISVQEWTPVDFLDLGPSAAVDKALQRLTADGKLSRISRGLYFRPGTHHLPRKPTTADVRAIVDAITRRDQSRVVVDGMTGRK